MLEMGIVILSEKVLEIIIRNMKIPRRTAPERTLRLLFCGTHCENLAMKEARKSKNILPTAFPNMTSAALPSCVQQVKRSANIKTRGRRKDENPFESSEVFVVLADFSLASRLESGVRLILGAFCCVRLPPPRFLHLEDEDSSD